MISYLHWHIHPTRGDHSLRRRGNARNVRVETLRWPINIMNSVDNTKLPQSGHYIMNLLSSLILFHLCALKWKLFALLTKAITQILISFDEWHSFLWLLSWSIWPSSLSTQLSSFSVESTKGKIEKENFCQNELKFSSNFFILLNKSYSMTLKASGDQGNLLE